VLLLCYPQLLGYTFNPLSVYFCHRANGELALIIYEVRNSFGDIHSYVLPVQPGELKPACGSSSSWLKGARLVPRPNVAAANSTSIPVLATPGRNHYTDRTLPAAGRKPEPRERALVR
jgi:DUF1365 family protein